ncbi:MAG: FtsX-like permease family protein [Hyphomicrobiaceae bacterium]|nr:FtsX-like permease family protein [Hyphomicrobiaceae bacterium]
MLFGDTAKLLGLVFGMAFSTLLITQQASMFVGIMQRTASLISETREPNIWVMDPVIEQIDAVRPMRDTELARVRGVPGVAWAVPFFKGQAVVTTAAGGLQSSFVYGLDDVTLIGLPHEIIMGGREALRRPDAIAIDEAGFEKLWPTQPLSLGESIEINDRRAVVAAIVRTAPPFQTQPLIYTRYSQALAFTNNGRNQLSYVLARSIPGQDPAAVAREIESRTGLKALTSEEFRWKTMMYFLRNTGIPVNFGTVVLLGVIVGIAVVGLTFNMFVTENLRQYAALKAMGLTNARLIGMVVLQAAVVGAIGYALGLGLTSVFFETATSSPTSFFRGFYLPWQVALGVGLLAAVIMLLSAIVSLRRVLVVDPAIVFRG